MNTSQSLQSHSAFLNLPLELRIHVYTHVFQPSTDIINSYDANRISITYNHFFPSPTDSTPLIPALCLANRQLYKEALPIYISTLILAPQSFDVLQPLEHWLHSISGNKTFEYVHALDFTAFSISVEHINVILAFLNRCNKLLHLRIKIHFRATGLAGAELAEKLIELFKLEKIVNLTVLQTLGITVDGGRQVLPSVRELEGLLGDVQMQRVKEKEGAAGSGTKVKRARIGARRLYSFTSREPGLTERIRVWFRMRWASEGRDVRVLEEENGKDGGWAN